MSKKTTKEKKKIITDDFEEEEERIKSEFQKGDYIMEKRSETRKRIKNKKVNKERPQRGQLTGEQEKEIRDAFQSLQMTDGKSDDPKIRADLFKKGMEVFTLDILDYKMNDEMDRILKEINKASKGKDNAYLSFDEFVNCMIEKPQEADKDIEKYFNILCGNGEDKITKERLRKICDRLGENISDEDLDDMIEIAKVGKDNKGEVDLEDFKKIMAKTNVFN